MSKLTFSLTCVCKQQLTLDVDQTNDGSLPEVKCNCGMTAKIDITFYGNNHKKNNSGQEGKRKCGSGKCDCLA